MPVLVSLFVVVALSLVIVRVGAVALTMTGLSRDVASFQAMCAFLRVGFTTKESEAIVSHPVRRKIARTLMLTGAAGITSTMAALVVTFAGQGAEELPLRAVLVVGGMVVLLIVARSRFLDGVMTRVIRRALAHMTRLDISDYQQLLELTHGYAVVRVVAGEGTWLAGRSLRELNVTAEGIVVLNMTLRTGKLVGTPTADIVINVGDELLCYGRAGDLEALSSRKSGADGDREHDEAVGRHAETEQAGHPVDDTGTRT